MAACPSQPRTNGPEPPTPGRCHHLVAALTGLVPNWLVELRYDTNGEAAIVILPDDLDDAIFPTLVARTDESAFHLDELRQDKFRKLAEHPTWTELLREVQFRLMWEMPTPTTLQ